MTKCLHDMRHKRSILGSHYINIIIICYEDPQKVQAS